MVCLQPLHLKSEITPNSTNSPGYDSGGTTQYNFI